MTKDKAKNEETQAEDTGLTFDLSFFETPAKATVSVMLPGYGVRVFNVVPNELPKVRAVRGQMTAWFGELQVLAKQFNHDADLREIKVREHWTLAVTTLIKTGVVPELNDEQAEQLAYHSGNFDGDLVFKLASYYGVTDILPFIRVRRVFDDIPI